MFKESYVVLEMEVIELHLDVIATSCSPDVVVADPCKDNEGEEIGF